MPLDLPAAVHDVVFTDGVFLPDGDLWLLGVPHDGESVWLIKANLHSGRVLVCDHTGLSVDEEAIGPDGNLWFGAEEMPSQRLVMGYVAANGSIRLFRLPPAFTGSAIYSLAAGPDGRVWFTASDHLANRWVGRVSTTGTFSLTEVRGPLLEWGGGLLLPAPDGGFLTYAGPAAESLDHILPTAQTRLTGPSLGPPWAEDRFGNIWDWDGDGRLVRYSLDGQLRALTVPAPPGGYPPGQASSSDGPGPGAVVTAADGDVWFTIAHSTYTAPVENGSSSSEDWLLGRATPGGQIQTWRAPFVGTDDDGFGTALGSDADPNVLFPGPDGRLYAVGYTAPPWGSIGPPDGIWHLFSVRLPDQPVMHPASVQLHSATIVGGQAQVDVSCTGHPGQLCAGMITLSSGGRSVGSEPYALAASLSAVHSLRLPRAGMHAAGEIDVRVTSRNALTRAVQTVQGALHEL